MAVARVRAATSRSSRSTRCRCTGGWTSAPRSRRPPSSDEIPHHLIDVADPSEDYTVVAFRRSADAALSRHRANARHRALLVGGTGLYLRAVVDRLEPPGEWPLIRKELECGARRRLAPRHGSTRSIPVAASRMTPTNRRRVIRALEVSLGSGRPFSSFGPGLMSYDTTEVTQIGLRVPRPVLTERIRERFDAQMAAGFLDEVARARREAGRPLSHRVAKRSGIASCSRICGVTSVSTTRSRWRSRAPANSPCAKSAGSAATRGSRGSTRPIWRIRWSRC